MVSNKHRRLVRASLAGLISTALLAVVSLTACKPKMNDESELRDLNRGQLASDNATLFTDPQIRNKKVVLIYYANDTYAPTSDDQAWLNKEALLKKIRSGKQSPNVTADQKALLDTIATRIDDDWNTFRRTVDVDARYLQQEICKTNPRYNMGLAIFRNFGNDISGQNISAMEYDRPFTFTYCKEGGQAFLGTTKVPYFQNDFRYNSQPLSHPYMFKRALEEVMTRFPPGIYRYILITKAHGAREIAIGPTIGVDVRSIQDKDVWSSLLGGKAAGTTQTLDTDKVTTPILDTDKVTTPILASSAISGTGGAAISAVEESLKDVAATMNASGLPYPPGVSKTDYLSALFGYGGGNPKLGMYLPIVFMESCKSDLRLSQNTWITDQLASYQDSYAGLSMENIGYLYTSDEKGLAYNTVDFKELFGPKYAKFSDFQDAFKSYLDTKVPASKTK